MIQNLYSGYVFIRYPVTITEIKEIIGANHEYHEVFTPVSISNLDLAKLSRLVNKVVKIIGKINLKYLISTMLIKILIIINILTPIAVSAKDLGVVGQTFNVVEEPFIEMLKKRLDKLDLEKEKQNIQARAKERVENPQAVSGINPARKDRIFYFDPSYILDKDAVLPCGKVLHKAGTRVNPLEHMDLGRRLFFIDSRQEDQIAWLKERLNNPLVKQEQ